ncbi:MAG: FAD-binding oxidoreductase [Gammaproteobacteria bacterium]
MFKRYSNSPSTISKFSSLFDNAQASFKATEKKVFFKHLNEAPHNNHETTGISRLFTESDISTQTLGEIRVFASQKKIRAVALKPGTELILGRHALADVLLDSYRVSDFHAKVICTEDRVYIEDLGSKKGTILQGQRLPAHQSTVLAHGLVAKIAGFELRFELNPHLQPNPADTFTAPEKQDEPVADIYAAQLLKNHEQIKPWPTTVSELTVVGIIDENHDTKTLRFTAAKPVLFHFQPGQFMTLSLTIKGIEVKRSYSIASSPSRPHVIEMTVKRVPGGLVSNWLIDQLKIGDVLKVKGPFGKFSCFNYPTPKILLLAAGSGIVPIMSMLRWITDTGIDIDIKLLLSFRTPADIIYRKELELIAARYPNVAIKIMITSDTITRKQWPGDFGRIKKTLLSDFVPDIIEREVFLCGPDAFMEQIRKLLARLKLPKNRLHCESFATISPPVDEFKQADPVLLQNRTGQYQVKFSKSGLEVVTDGAESLLELAAIYGIQIDNECRSGNCGECMVKCLAGDITMLEQSEISERDKQAGWVYSCCAYPKSNVVLDI